MPRALLLFTVFLLSLGFPAPWAMRAEDGEAKLGTPVTALTYAITQPGVYVLKTDLSTGIAGGRAIDVQADNVTIDLNGHTLTNANAANTAAGIGGTDRRNVTVRNGSLKGFLAGVDLVSTVGDGSLSSGHLVENLRVSESPWFGVRVIGSANVVRGCQVLNSGGTAQGDGQGYGQGYGIVVQGGSAARVLDNDVEGVRKGNAALSAFGVFVTAMSDALVVGNRISGPADYGIHYTGDASGKYRGNLVGAGVSRPFYAPTATDAGKNIVDSDGDGIDDDWERRYFSNLTTATATSDSDGDGVSDLAEYQANTSPTDFYNGATPTLVIFSGDGQGGLPGGYLSAPLVVRVTTADTTQPRVNAPVRFTVNVGEGRLAAVPGVQPSASSTSLDVRTDATGQARCYVFMPTGSTTAVGQVIATAITAGPVASVSFKAGLIPTNGTRLWLRADAGLTKDAAGSVSAWADQSGQGHDATQTSAGNQPALVNAALNGRPVVRFDYTRGAYLKLPDTMAGASAGDLFAVVKAKAYPAPVNTGNRGFMQWGSYVFPGYNGFPAYPDFDGNLKDSFGSANAYYNLGAPAQPIDQFHLYNATSQPGRWAASYNGLPVFQAPAGTNVVGFTTAPILGYGFSSNNDSFFDGDIAEVLVFDRVLSVDERWTVQQYLAGRYSLGGSIAPTAPANLVARALSPTQISLTWSYDLSAPSSTTRFVVERKLTVGGGYIQIATLENTTSYFDTTATINTAYTYRVRVANYAGASGYSTEAETTTPATGIGLPVGNLRLWLRADAGAAGSVSAWADQSGQGHDATQTSAGNQPALVNAALNGRPVVRFDYTRGAYLKLPDTMAGASAGDLFAVVKAKAYPAPVNTGNRGFMQWGSYVFPGYNGFPAYPDFDGNLKDSFGSANAYYNLGAPAQPIDQFHLYNATSQPGRWAASYNGLPVFQAPAGTNVVGFTTAPILGYGFSSNNDSFFDGDIAEVLVFDRALPPEERTVVELYLGAKYLIPGMDTDSDGLTNAQEIALGTNPLNPDTNGDGLWDGISLMLGVNPAILGATTFSGIPDPYNLPTYPPSPDPNDHIPPIITLLQPGSAVPVP